MKPDFALSLSFEGIGLLYRQNSSWANVGYVDLAAENLPEQLEQLNSKGQRVSGQPLRSKIVIPNEQIRYIVVVYTEQEVATSLQVEAALTGATPYAVSDLVYDRICMPANSTSPQSPGKHWKKPSNLPTCINSTQ